MTSNYQNTFPSKNIHLLTTPTPSPPPKQNRICSADYQSHMYLPQQKASHQNTNQSNRNLFATSVDKLSGWFIM